jgi:hypothetical protein
VYGAWYSSGVGAPAAPQATVHPLLLHIFGRKRAEQVTAAVSTAVAKGRAKAPGLRTLPGVRSGPRARIKVLPASRAGVPAPPVAPAAPDVSKFDAEQQNRIKLAKQCLADAQRRNRAEDIARFEDKLRRLLAGEVVPIVCITGLSGFGAFDVAQHKAARAALDEAWLTLFGVGDTSKRPPTAKQFVQAIMAVGLPALYVGLTPAAAGAFMLGLQSSKPVWDAMGTGDVNAAFAAMEAAAMADGQQPPPANVQQANKQNVYDAGKEIAKALGEPLYLKLGGGIPTAVLIGGAVVLGAGLLWLVLRSRSPAAETEAEAA